MAGLPSLGFQVDVQDAPLRAAIATLKQYETLGGKIAQEQARAAQAVAKEQIAALKVEQATFKAKADAARAALADQKLLAAQAKETGRTTSQAEREARAEANATARDRMKAANDRARIYQKEAADAARAAKQITDNGVSAAQARAAAEKKWADTTARVSKLNTDELIGHIKHLQDEKQKLANASLETTSRTARAELKIQKDTLDAELRAAKQHALERPAVNSGGAGGKVGLLGTGRQLAGGLKDAAMGQAQSMASSVPGGGAIAALGPAGIAAAAGIGVAVVALKSAIDVGSRFEDTMADMRAITGLSAQEVAKIGENSKAAAVKFGMSASEVANSSKLLISALGPGIAKDAKALDTLTNNTLTLAKATGEDANVAAKAITVTMGQFGLNTLSAAEQAKQSTRIINVLGAAAQKGNAEVGDLSEGMKASGTVAAQSGVTIEQTAAALEVLAANEIKGSEGGVGFRNVMLKMSSGSKEAQDSLKGMGLTFADINPKKVGLEQGLMNLKKGFDNLKDPVEKAAAAKKIFGLENAAAANAMLQNIPLLKQMTKDVTGTSTAFEQAKIKQATFSESMNRGKAVLENVGIAIYEGIKPALMALMEGVEGIMPTLEFVANLLGDVLPIAINILIAPAKLLAGAIQAIKEYLAGLAERWDGFATKIKTVLAPALNALSKVWDGLKGAMKSVGDYLAGAWNTIVQRAIKAFNFVKDAVMSVVNVYIQLYKWIFQGVAAVAKFVTGFLGLGGTVEKVVGWITKAYEAIRKVIGAVTDFLGITGEEKEVKVKAVVSTEQAPETAPADAIVPGVEGAPTEGATGSDKPAKEKGPSYADKRKAEFEAEIKVLEEEARKKQVLLDLEAANTNMSADKYERAKLEIQQGSAQARMDFARKFAADTKASEKQLQAGFLQQATEFELELAQAKKAGRTRTFEEEKSILEKQHADRLAIVEQQYTDGIIGEEVANRDKLASERKFQEALRAQMVADGQEVTEITKQILTLKINGAKAELKVFEAGLMDMNGEFVARLNAAQIAADAGQISQAQLKREQAQVELEVAQQVFDKAVELGVATTKLSESVLAKKKAVAAAEIALQKEVVKSAEEQMKRAQEAAAALAIVAGELLDVQGAVDISRLEAQHQRKMEKLKGNGQQTAAQEAALNQRRIQEEKEFHDKKLDLEKQAQEKRLAKVAEVAKKELGIVGANLLFRKGMLGQFLKENLMQLALNKGAELAIWIQTELAKDGATLGSVAIRMGAMALEGAAWLANTAIMIASSIAAGAAAMAAAAAQAVVSVVTAIPFPFNLALIPAAIGAVYLAYRGIKKMFKFADGGVTKRPQQFLFGSQGQHLGERGEAGEEAIVPLNKYPGMRALLEGNGVSSGSNAGAAIVAGLQGVRDAVLSDRPVLLPVDKVQAGLNQKKIKDSFVTM